MRTVEMKEYGLKLENEKSPQSSSIWGGRVCTVHNTLYEYFIESIQNPSSVIVALTKQKMMNEMN